LQRDDRGATLCNWCTFPPRVLRAGAARARETAVLVPTGVRMQRSDDVRGRPSDVAGARRFLRS
jgi:hypothetical protein